MYQAAVLLQFNQSGDSLSYQDISVGTGMNDEVLKPVLQLLTKQRVIDLKDEMYELNLGAWRLHTLVRIPKLTIGLPPRQVSSRKRSGST